MPVLLALVLCISQVVQNEQITWIKVNYVWLVKIRGRWALISLAHLIICLIDDSAIAGFETVV